MELTTTVNEQSSIRSYFGYTEDDRTNAVWQNICFNAIIYVHFFLCFYSALPYWTFCLAVIVYVPRWTTALHELLHLCSSKTINRLVDLNLLILTPISLGYRETRDIHMRHHASAPQPHDPDYYHIKGSVLSGYLNAIFSPELSVYFWLRDKGITQGFILGVSVRLFFFVLLVWICQWQSLWYFIPVRIAYGSSLFWFSYVLHRKNGEHGNFQRSYGRFFENNGDILSKIRDIPSKKFWTLCPNHGRYIYRTLCPQAVLSWIPFGYTKMYSPARSTIN